MDVFAQYEESFLEETNLVTNHVSQFNYERSAGDKQAALQSARNSLRKAEGLLKQMEAHSRDMDAGTRSQMRSKLSQYKKSMLSLRSDIDRAESQGQRDAVLGGMSSEARAQHERMGDATQRYRDQNDTVRNALAQALDTEDVALGITDQLHNNRETIMSARKKARDTASLTDKARYIVRDMSRREARRKIFIVCFGFFLLVIVIVVIVLISHDDSKSGGDSGGASISGDTGSGGSGGGGGRRRLLLAALSQGRLQ
eukprot:g2024.t1